MSEQPTKSRKHMAPERPTAPPPGTNLEKANHEEFERSEEVEIRNATSPPALGGLSRQLADAKSFAECPTNIDLRSWKGRALAVAAGAPGDVKLDQAGQCRFRATHYIIFPDERTDEKTGEVSRFVRTVFFDKEGRTYRTSAGHGMNTLDRLLSLFTPEEWSAGIPLVITLRVSEREKRQYHDIRVDLSEPS